MFRLFQLPEMAIPNGYVVAADLRLISYPVHFEPLALCDQVSLYAVGRALWLNLPDVPVSAVCRLRLVQFFSCKMDLRTFARLRGPQATRELLRCAGELDKAFGHYQRWVVHQLGLRRHSCFAASAEERRQALLLVQPLPKFGRDAAETARLRQSGFRSMLELTRRLSLREMREQGLFSEAGLARFYAQLQANGLESYCRFG